MKAIKGFRGEYFFLSNFAPCKKNYELGEYNAISYEGYFYPTVEHAFQAAKTLSQGERKPILMAETAKEAKSLGRRVTLRKDWEDVKIEIMYNLLWQKFILPEYREKLLATGDAILIESNNWNDKFWGICHGAGENNLGKLLMRIREELRSYEF